MCSTEMNRTIFGWLASQKLLAQFRLTVAEPSILDDALNGDGLASQRRAEDFAERTGPNLLAENQNGRCAIEGR